MSDSEGRFRSFRSFRAYGGFPMEREERPKDAALSYRGVGKERRGGKGGGGAVSAQAPGSGGRSKERRWREEISRHLRTWSALRDGREMVRGRLRCRCGVCVERGA
jgi:hypothetical protein